jgi:hypothetical protein
MLWLSSLRNDRDWYDAVAFVPRSNPAFGTRSLWGSGLGSNIDFKNTLLTLSNDKLHPSYSIHVTSFIASLNFKALVAPAIHLRQGCVLEGKFAWGSDNVVFVT